MAASNGVRASGIDGYDFEHRQKIAAQYQISAVNKSRLKLCIFMHFLLCLIMCGKLAEDVLDRLDVFVMEIEALDIPKPDLWEYTWTAGILVSFLGLSAVRRNVVGRMQLYMFGIIFCCLVPILYAALYYFADLWAYITSSAADHSIGKWQGYPLAVLWFIFIASAFQVHLFSLYFAEQLVQAWKARGGLKSKNQ